jgi:hypothetical protein
MIDTNTTSINLTNTQSGTFQIQTDTTGPGNIELLKTNQYITPNYPNMEKQIKVAVFLTEVENNEIISSTFLKEGWIRRSHKNANLNLLAVKEFDISLEDLDKIVVKEIVSITF